MGGFPRDSLDERFHSKVMSLDTLPKAQLFQLFPRKNRWKLITRGENATGNRYVQADAWNAPVWFSTTSFSTLSPCLWYIQDKRKSFSFPMERVLALPFLHQFSPKAGRNSLLARDVISFVKRVRLGLIVILEVAMVGRYSVL